MTTSGHLLLDTPYASLRDYRSAGGGEGLARAGEIGPGATIAEITDARLRGRSGGGFPTGIKWSGVASSDDTERRFLVCNAAEGAPGVF